MSWTRDVDAPATGGGDEIIVSLADMAIAPDTPPPGVQSLVLPVAIGGVGVAAFVAGGIMVAVGVANGNSAANTPGAATDPVVHANAQNARQSAVDLETAGFVVGGVGVVAVAAGTLLFLLSRAPNGPAGSHPGSAHLAPVMFPLFPRGEGVGVGGTF